MKGAENLTKTIQKELQNSFKNNSGNIAIEYGKITLTYSELEKKSNYIANYIISKNIKPKTAIGILVESKLEVISIILGILKAGCIFVPLDSNYPVNRTLTMMEISEMKLLFIDSHNINNFESLLKEKTDIEVISIDNALYTQYKLEHKAKQQPDISYNPNDAIYMYFTSGSTGQPKAIVGKNESLLQFIEWEIDEFGINEHFRMSQFTSQCHDPYLRDIFLPLLTGATICIPEVREIILDTESLIEWIDKEKITLIHCTPSLFKVFNSSKLNGNNFADLKFVLLAGEKINPKNLINWYQVFDERIQLVNLYGPTETTLAKLFYFIKKEDCNRNNIPIGKPIKKARAIIVDNQMRVCSDGIKGEIIIRSPYLTLGYYNNDEENKRKFIVNPFTNNFNDIVYRTGDYGRITPEGDIEFLGRMDRQIKIRGIRIELEEIEHFLLKHSLVKEAVVDVKERENNNKIICAYIIFQNKSANENTDNSSEITEISQYLKEKLPNYMVPQSFMAMDKFPITENGKIDYKALPIPLYYDIEKNETIIWDDIDKEIRDIWCKILGIKEVGINVNFLDIGGDSLNIMTMIAEINQKYNIEFPLGYVFENPTIKGISQHIRTMINKEQQSDLSIKLAPSRSYYPLSSEQKRMFISNFYDSNNAVYNISAAVIIEGKINVKKMEESFRILISRHESLRTVFLVVDDEPYQKIIDEFDWSIDYMEAKEEKIDDVIKDYIKPFDLSKAPLFRIGLVKVGLEKHYLIFDMHHIISDAVSSMILLNEIRIMNNKESLPTIPIQYKDYAFWQGSMRNTDKFKECESYWINKFKETVPVLDMPTDYERTDIKSYKGKSFDYVISKKLTKDLEALAIKNNVTLYMLLSSIYLILINKYSKQNDITIGTPITNRPHKELENVVGMFVNILPIRNQLHPDMSFLELLQEVRRNSIEAFNNRFYQFEELVNKLKINRVSNRHPIFDIVFTMQDINVIEQKIGNVKLVPHRLKDKLTKFDLLLFATMQKENIYLSLEYLEQLYKRETIEKMMKRYIEIMESVVDNQNILLKDINFNMNIYKAETTFSEDDSSDFLM